MKIIVIKIVLFVQIEGSGDYDYGGNEDEEDYEDVTPDSREIPTMASPVFPEPTATTPRLQTQHPHRHHHGQEEIEEEEEAPVSPANSPALVVSIVPTPSLVPIRPTRLSDLVTPDSPDSIEPSRVGVEDFMPVTPSFTPSYTPEPDYGESEEIDENLEGTRSSSSSPSSPQVNLRCSCVIILLNFLNKFYFDVKICLCR